MPQLAVARRDSNSVAQSSETRARSRSDPASPARDRIRSRLLGLAVSLGLATGLVELAVHFIRRKFINPKLDGRSPVEPASLLDGTGLGSR